MLREKIMGFTEQQYLIIAIAGKFAKMFILDLLKHDTYDY